jgi:ribosomal protein S18 acetylase RimI-like enzyme
MIVKRANIIDAEEILALQKLAYQSEAEIYQDYTIPPLIQTLKEINTEFKNHIFLKAVREDMENENRGEDGKDGGRGREIAGGRVAGHGRTFEDEKIFGSVRARLINPETCYIGRLIVHPKYQNRGIGNRLMDRIEVIFKENKRFELITGHQSKKNLHFYKKRGYKIFKRQKLTDNLDMLYLEKFNSQLR